MNTIEALGTVREGLQIRIGNRPVIDVRGQEVAVPFAQDHNQVFNEFRRRPVGPVEVERAWQLASRINRIYGPVVDGPNTLYDIPWFGVGHREACRCLGRMATAFERAAQTGMINPERVDAYDFSIQFVAESLVTSAITGLGKGKGGRPSDVSVYMNPLEVARLRAENPDMADGFFGVVMDYACRTKRLLPQYFEWIREEQISRDEFIRSCPTMRQQLLTTERRQIDKMMYEEWPPRR